MTQSTDEAETSSPESWEIRTTVRQFAVGFGPTVAAVALLVSIAARRYLPLANADALLPALMSTQHLTFFYWGQDRLANLVPALTWPIRDPLWNFRFQMLIYGSSFFALIAMFAWFHVHTTGRRAHGWVQALTIGISGLLVMAPMRAWTGYELVFEQVYGLSAALFLLGGRWAVDGTQRWRGRRPAGSTLILLAVLLNPSVVLYSPALALLDDGTARRSRRLIVAVVIVVVAFLGYSVASAALYDGPSNSQAYSDFSFNRARHGLDAAVSNVLGSVHLSIACVIGAACVTILIVRWRHLPTRLRLAYLGAPVFGLFWLAAFSANRWVEINVFTFRYFFPLYAAGMLIISGTVAETSELVRHAIASRARPERSGSRPPAWVVCSLVAVSAIVVAIVVVGATHIDALTATSDDLELIDRYDLRLVAGDYWTTWPVVVAGRDRGLDLLGVSDRSQPIADDIVQEVNTELATTGVVRALCPVGDAGRCASQLAAITDRSWAAQPITSSGPMVIEARPIP